MAAFFDTEITCFKKGECAGKIIWAKQQFRNMGLPWNDNTDAVPREITAQIAIPREHIVGINLSYVFYPESNLTT